MSNWRPSSIYHKKKLFDEANSIQKNVNVEYQAKKSGGVREICKPKYSLKKLLQRINKRIFQIPLPDYLQGSVPGHSPITNAQIHVGQSVVLKLDIRDFYPSVHFTRVQRLLIEMGFSQEVSQFVTKLVTFKGHLAQGFPTSSSIANLVLAGISPRIEKLCLDHDLRFSFYQDDLTVSGKKRVVDIKKLFSKILRQEGFKINQQKLKIMKNTERQEVTGLVVNKKVNVSKDEYRNLRAILHQCKTNGLETTALAAVAQNKAPEKVKRVEREKLPERFKQNIYGRILRVVEINPAKGKKLLAEYFSLFG